MNNFFNNFIKIIFSFFGIGYIPKVSKFFAVILTLVLVYQLPEENRAEYILVVILFLVLSFVLFFKKFFDKPEQKSKIVLNRVTGIVITMVSPFILYSYEWMIISLFLFFTFLNISLFDKLTERVKPDWLKFIQKDLISGCLSLICLNIFYAGYDLYPLIVMYLKK